MKTGDRVGSLEEVAAQLWPPPLEWRLGRGADLPVDRLMMEFVVTPNLTFPRLVLPTRGPAWRAALAEGFGRSLAKRAKSTALAATFAMGCAGRLFPDRLRIYRPPESGPRFDTINAHLADVLGQPVDLAFQVTRARANRKPVLRILDRKGRTRAFAKVGGNELTRNLVRTEGRALKQLSSARLPYTTVPEVIDLHRWHDLELLILAPLPVRAGTSQPRDVQITRSALDIANSAPVTMRSVVESEYWRDLRIRVDALRSTSAGQQIHSALPDLIFGVGDLVIPFSAWHGDWAPWNLARDGGRLLAWDFERYRTGVPMGFDVVHYTLQTMALSSLVDPQAAIMERWRRVAPLLAPLGLTKTQSEGVFVLYLAEISTRWVADHQGEVGDWSATLNAMLGALAESARQLAAQGSRTE